ncbi:MAG: hypothetical protein ABFR47_06055, partial [Verrucomicrobiota bacterium]
MNQQDYEVSNARKSTATMTQRFPYTFPAQTAMSCFRGLLLTIVLVGCGSLPPNLISTNAVTVERIDSSRARIGSLYVGESKGRLKIRGRLNKRHAGRSPIPGHLHIEVFAKDGEMLEEGVVRYYRHNTKSGVSYFSREFTV